VPVDTDRGSQLGTVAVELYRMVSGEQLSATDAIALGKLLERDTDGKWENRRPRGWFSGPVLEARALAGVFLFGEQQIVWSTYLYQSAQEAFRRLRGLIDGSDALRLQVKRHSAARGDERIDLHDGRQFRFIHRGNPRSGRGLSADCLLLDEAGRDDLNRTLDEAVPMLHGRPNSQLVVSYG
jgi:hypothetical protein